MMQARHLAALCAAAFSSTLASCANLPAPQRLEGTQWNVVALDGEAVTAQPPPTLAIDAQGRVSGSDGCNRFSGGLSFDASGSAQADGHGISTKMACIGERDALSRRYNALRGGVTNWRVEQGTLVLSTRDGRTIRLRPAI